MKRDVCTHCRRPITYSNNDKTWAHLDGRYTCTTRRGMFSAQPAEVSAEDIAPAVEIAAPPVAARAATPVATAPPTEDSKTQNRG